MDKKALKKQYTKTIQPMGVYQIKNLKNGKVFIGSHLNVQGKINSQRFQLEHNSSRIKEMQDDFNKVGAENFEFTVVDLLKPKDEPDINYSDDLKFLEEMWIQKLQPFGEKGYNRL